MAFAYDKAVAVFPTWVRRVDTQDLAIKNAENVRHRQGAANVGSARSIYHPQSVSANSCRKFNRKLRSRRHTSKVSQMKATHCGF
jgi:hypothetical protein